MQFGEAFSYVFKDPDWIKKLALAGLVSLIPVIGQFFLIGWGVEVARRVINNDPTPLPGIEFGAFLSSGFKAWVIMMVYAIPIFIFVLPIQLVTPIAASLELDMDVLQIVMVVVSVCCGGLLLVYSIFMGFMLPAALGNFAAKGTIGAGLRFGEVFALVKTRPVSYLLVLLGGILGSFIGQLGVIICVVGVIITMAYYMAIYGHLIGQAYNDAATPASV
jgi:xanthosine utilization system XapX-like protein